MAYSSPMKKRLSALAMLLAAMTLLLPSPSSFAQAPAKPSDELQPSPLASPPPQPHGKQSYYIDVIPATEPPSSPQAHGKPSPQLSAGDILNKLTSLTSDEMKLVYFSWQSEEGEHTASLSVQIHNPFRNITIHGIVVEVSCKDKTTPHTFVTFDVFIPVEAGPLQRGTGVQDIYKGDNLEPPNSQTGASSKEPAGITLKEIHYDSDLAGAKPTTTN